MPKPFPTTTEEHLASIYGQLRTLAGHTHPGLVSDGSDPPPVDYSAAITALDEDKVDKGALVFNVKDYGALGNGVADDTDAIMDAQAAAGNRTLFFPNGTYKCSDPITAQTVIGESRQRTVIQHTADSIAIGIPTAGVQSYHRRVENLTLRGQGDSADVTAGTGLYLDSASVGVYRNLLIEDFTQALWMRSTSGIPQQCLYNTFIDCIFQDSYYGARLDDISNENRFIACRVNIATRGFQINSGNHNIIESCAIENCSERGISIPDPGSNETRGNVVAFTRFEDNVANMVISASVQLTGLIFNRMFGGLVTDNGTGTMRIDQESGGVAAGRYATGSRPSTTGMSAGTMVYDTTLLKPIWWSGSAWKDASGATV